MKSFNNDPKLKEMLIEETVKHREADEIIQGSYVKDGKYCAVGCSIHTLNVKLGKEYRHNDHSVYETELGIPRIIARLEDGIFEGLDKEEAKTFPERFISAIPVGVDLEMVWSKFAVWLLGDAEHGVIKFAKTDAQKKPIQDIVDLYIKKVAGENIEIEKWRMARSAAYAADAAAYAADADTAAYAAAAYAAFATADATADTASYAAAAAAYAAAAAAAAAHDAKEKARKIQANKLIDILRESE